LDPTKPFRSQIRFASATRHGRHRQWHAYDGLFRRRGDLSFFPPIFATVDAPRGARQAAVVYIYTHDSIGVGEDGPRTSRSRRVGPAPDSGFDVIPPPTRRRPRAPLPPPRATDGPTLLALTRQAVPMLNTFRPTTAARRVSKGLRRVQGDARSRTFSSRAAANCSSPSPPPNLGPGVRVVSMPSFLRFDRQPAE